MGVLRREKRRRFMFGRKAGKKMSYGLRPMSIGMIYAPPFGGVASSMTFFYLGVFTV